MTATIARTAFTDLGPAKHHVEVLDGGAAVDLFEALEGGAAPSVPAAAASVLPGLTGARAQPVPADRAWIPAGDVRAIMLLGAARELVCEGVVGRVTVVPGDLLELAPGTAFAVVPSDDRHDHALVLALS